MATYWENSCSFGLRYVSWYKYLIVSFVFSHLGFWSGNLFLIAPFPDLCLLVPFFGGEIIFVLLAKFFTAMLKHSHAPDDIKRGIIITLFKGGNKRKDNPDNYRAITLSSVILKLFERILLTRIQLFDNLCPPIHPLQGGFQKNMGCLMTSFLLSETANYANENGSLLYVCFLDVRKAFDCVWHDGLFYKLYNIGIDKAIFKILQNLYRGMTSCVKFHGCRSDWFPINQGTRQGGSYFPFPFSSIFQ